MMAKNSSHGTPEQFEHLVRQRIEELSGSVESTTSITADTNESGLFADPNGVIGDAGELYTYQELKQMYDDGIADDDQWFASYPTFEHWYRQIVLGYLTRVTSEADLVNDDEEDLGSWKLLGSKQVLDTDGFWTDYTLWVNNETGTYVCIFGDNDIYTPETASPDFETESEFEAYEWFEDYDTGELEGEDDIYDEIHDYFDNEEELAEISSIPAIRDTAAMSWWGDGDDFIHYLKNLDTGEMLYQTDDSMYEEYDDDDYDVE